MSENEHYLDTLPIDSPEVQLVKRAESLPFIDSFEHFLYDNRVTRSATHTMSHGEEMTVRVDDLKPFFDEDHELMHVFDNYQMHISELVVSSVETTDHTTLNVSFITDGTRHTLSQKTSEDLVLHSIGENFVTEPTRFESTSITRFAAALVFACARAGGNNSPSKFDLVDASLDIERIGHAESMERLIMTLGQYEGRSEVETHSLVSTKSGLIEITQTSRETKDNSDIDNELRLELFHVIDGEVFDQGSHLLQFAEMHDEVDNRDVQYGRRMKLNSPYQTIERSRSKEWLELCAEFMTEIDVKLKEYSHYDSQDG